MLAAVHHDRLLALGGLVTVIVLAWAWLLLGAGMGEQQMDMGGGQMMPMPAAWTGAYTALIFLMWAVMMMAMMLPSATPTILLVGALARARASNPSMPTASAFASGYMLVWIAFSGAATALQFWLDRSGLLTGAMATASTIGAGILLILAGLYQWSPLKQACLRHCRAPADFLVRHWRQGSWGALVTGVHHGLFCLGCCWMLMTLLFVGSLMNLLWIAGLAALILVEKTLPAGRWVSHLTGGALVAWGGVVLWTAA